MDFSLFFKSHWVSNSIFKVLLYAGLSSLDWTIWNCKFLIIFENLQKLQHMVEPNNVLSLPNWKGILFGIKVANSHSKMLFKLENRDFLKNFNEINYLKITFETVPPTFRGCSLLLFLRKRTSFWLFWVDAKLLPSHLFFL